VLAADFVSPEAINFMATHARGLICLTLTEERCRQLNIPLMVNENRSPMGTAFTLSIEGRNGREHRNLGGRPRAYRARGHREARQARRHRAARPHLPGDGAEGRCPRSRRPHRSRMRPAGARGAHARRGHLRDHESGRLHGAHARARRIRRTAWPEDRHDLRPHPLSQRDGEARRARGRSQHRHAVWAIPPVHLSRQDRGPGPLRAREGRTRPGPADAGARARAVRLAGRVRLRPVAPRVLGAGCDCAWWRTTRKA